MLRAKPIILLVDDDENDLFLIAAAFVDVGVSTAHSVVSAKAAIAYLDGTDVYADRIGYPYPDIVVTDLEMPEGGGTDVLEYLRRTPETTTRIVVLTGSPDNDDMMKAYSLGAWAYHVKPTSPDALRSLIEALNGYWLRCEVPERVRTGSRPEPSSSSPSALVPAFGPFVSVTAASRSGNRWHSSL